MADETDTPANAGIFGTTAEDLHATGRGTKQTGQYPKQRRFSGAVGPGYRYV
jgi:hypothetical protein